MNKKRATPTFLGVLPRDALAEIGTFLTTQELRHLCQTSQEFNRQWPKLIVHLCLAPADLIGMFDVESLADLIAIVHKPPADLIAEAKKNKFHALFANTQSLVIQVNTSIIRLLPLIVKLIQPTIQRLVICCENGPWHARNLLADLPGYAMLTKITIIGDLAHHDNHKSRMFTEFMKHPESGLPPLLQKLTVQAVDMSNRKLFWYVHTFNQSPPLVEQEEKEEVVNNNRSTPLPEEEEEDQHDKPLTRLAVSSHFHYECQMLQRLSLRWQLAEERAQYKDCQQNVQTWMPVSACGRNNSHQYYATMILQAQQNNLHRQKALLRVALQAFDELNY